MSTEPPKEHPSAYFVQDRDNREEMARLEVQDKLLTRGLGGVLPELADPSHLRSVLDVGCGTSGWLIETAREYPMIEKLVGVDISGKMLGYARAQAETQLFSINLEATHNSGRLFTASGDGIIGELAHLMTRYGIEDVQTRVQTLTYRAGTLEGQQYCENLRYGMRVLLPFFQKYASVPRDYHEMSQQALEEMQAPDFVATQSFLTAWGTRSTSLGPLLHRKS